MLFCTVDYLVFFALVFFLYWAMPWRQGRVWLLLVASFYFYACWNHWLALIIFATTIVDYLIGLGLATLATGYWRRLLLSASLLMNLGLLCYFKYVNFFLDSLEASLHAVGASAVLPTLWVILPVGISFYTFEAISYTVDVYKRRIPAERNLSHFLLFITFFPHLVAGPIVRARDFLPQARRRKRFSWPRMQVGVQLFLLGLVKKLVIADRMALLVDPMFRQPELYSSSALWIATLAYAVQLYCDFSGYSDMALGSAHMLGYKLTVNFNMPFLSKNMAEFWRRWHISLSNWLRDYLYIPLGGSRRGPWRVQFNLLLTMTLCGLWHGAAWHFVIFGFLHGLLLVLNRRFRGWCASYPRLHAWLGSAPGVVCRVACTFFCFATSLVIFRAATLVATTTMYQRLFWPSAGASTPICDENLWGVVLLLVLGHALGCTRLWERSYRRLPGPVLGFGYAAVLSLMLLFTLNLGKTFVYFQF
jgi:alginate O-acetyltransferase complex protein AlgI